MPPPACITALHLHRRIRSGRARIFQRRRVLHCQGRRAAWEIRRRGLPDLRLTMSSTTGATFFGWYAKPTQEIPGGKPWSVSRKTTFHWTNRAGGQVTDSPVASCTARSMDSSCPPASMCCRSERRTRLCRRRRHCLPTTSADPSAKRSWRRKLRIQNSRLAPIQDRAKRSLPGLAVATKTFPAEPATKLVTCSDAVVATFE